RWRDRRGKGGARELGGGHSSNAVATVCHADRATDRVVRAGARLATVGPDHWSASRRARPWRCESISPTTCGAAGRGVRSLARSGVRPDHRRKLLFPRPGADGVATGPFVARVDRAQCVEPVSALVERRLFHWRGTTHAGHAAG